MIGISVTSIVKWISCTIILVIAQRQSPFRQLNAPHAVFSVSYFNGNMLSPIKSKRS